MSAVLLAGVDEAGRGPLAGPVFAAAVILHPDRSIAGLTDSKKLSATRRDRLFQRIQADSLCWAIAQASVEEIDQLNILQASLLAMWRAVDALTLKPTQVWVDGNRLPAWEYPARAVVGGDASVPEISAASILAKVARDRVMVEMESLHPGYGFARHKGYPTVDHLRSLRQLGPSKIHRQSYAPVRQASLFGDALPHA